MTTPLLRSQAELPLSIPLIRYAPNRKPITLRDLDPKRVLSTQDLPEYLILGALDPSSFECSGRGWSARWVGPEEGTCFDVAYRADSQRWEIRQAWCGQDGSFAIHPATMSLDKVIMQMLAAGFPAKWDSEAKSRLEAKYQVTVVEQPKSAYAFHGIPDGAFRTIVCPISVRNLRAAKQWIEGVVEDPPSPYPVNVEAKLVFQAINYLEGKAPSWTANGAVAFYQSVSETGLAPTAFPVREQATDGSAAWTLRRELYALFISMPFAGMLDFFERAATPSGPVRESTDPALRLEMQPIVIPAGLEVQTEHLSLWDTGRTTRSFLQFVPPGRQTALPTIAQTVADQGTATSTLARAESISANAVGAVERLFNNEANKGRAP